MSAIEKIEELLKEKGWTKYRLAKESGLPQSTITSLLSGRVKNPSAESLIKIANALGVSTGVLLGEEDPELISIYDKEGDIKRRILELLKLFTDDEGAIEEKYRDEIYRIFGGHLPLGPETDRFDMWYANEFLSTPKEELDEKTIEEAYEEFDRHYNYKTIKRGIQNHNHLIISNKNLDDFLGELEELANKHGLITKNKEQETDQYATEKEFLKKFDILNNLELTNEMLVDKILETFNITFEGKRVTKEEAKILIENLRTLRRWMNHQREIQQ